MTKDKVAGDRRGFHDDPLPRTGRRIGEAGVSENGRSVLADLLFGHDQGTIQKKVLRRFSCRME